MSLDVIVFNPGAIAAIVYGILAIVGGIMGYIQARSTVSLSAGVGCGLLLVMSALSQFLGQSSAQAWGLWGAIAITGILIVAFLMRLLKTRKFMPAGLMLICGLAALAVMVGQVIV
jgi:uncharacterized membrane protein (UPF0136 family)